MNKEKFLKCELKNISQVYFGKRNWCRCGCGGEYIASTYMKEPRSAVNNAIVSKWLKRAVKMKKQDWIIMVKNLMKGNKLTQDIKGLRTYCLKYFPCYKKDLLNCSNLEDALNYFIK